MASRHVKAGVAAAPATPSFDAPIDAPLRRKTTVGFVVAVLLTVFIGLSSWRGARRAEQDAYWVSHTHEVMETIQRVSRHLIEAETSARAFVLTGQEPLLAHYQAARDKIYRDEGTLRLLTADNLSQQRRLDVLGQQVSAALEFAESLIAKRRQMQVNSGGSDALEIETHIDVVTATTRDMYAEEARLLVQRAQRAVAGQWLTRVIAIAGAVLEVGLWVLAKLAVNREIHASSGARAKLSTLNAELEARVEERTAALQAEIADRKRESEGREHLAAIVDSSDDAIIRKDLDGTINAWNQGAEKIFGYPASEAVGKPMLMLFPTELVHEEPDILTRIRRGESVEHYETVRVRKDGKSIDVSVTISPIRDGNGAIIGVSTIARDITDRKRTQEALRQSDVRRGFALDTAKIGDWDLDLTTLQATRSALHDQIFGYPSPLKEWSFDIFLRHVHAGDRERIRETFQSSVRQKKKSEFECRIVWPNGEIHWIWACGDQIRDASGKATQMFGIIQDITERKRSDEVLRESEERFRLFIEYAPAALAMFDREMRYLHLSLRWRSDYGMGEREMRGVSHYELFPEIPERWKEIHRRALAGEVLRDENDRFDRADGSVKWLRWDVRPWRDGTGAIAGILAFTEDITERKLAQDRLAGQAEELTRQAEELMRSQHSLETQTLMLQSVLDSMQEGLVAADETGKFLLWNPAATRIVGMGAENVSPGEWNRHYGVYLSDTVTPFPPEQNPLLRAIRGEACVAEMYLHNQELESGVWIESSASPLKSKDGTLRGGVIAIRDITRRILDERKIHQLNEELEERVVERTAQLEAANHELEAFTYSVSHDLRAPLRHIGGFSKILSEDFGAGMPAEAQSYLQRVQDGVHRMGLLVDELLNLARVGRQALQLQSTRLNTVIEEVVSLLQPEVNGRAVTWKIAELPAVECDPILIKQVFQNLIANALKFTRTRERALIEISQRQEGRETVIAVSDNGVGFSMKYKGKLFGVFQRLHRAEDFEGTGIGLATVQRIVRKHGGRVWAEGELDKGATFYFTLATAESAPAKPENGNANQDRLTEAGTREVENKSAVAGG